MSEKTTDKFYDLLEDFDSAMLVTSTSEGELRARPMSLGKPNDDGGLYFATSKTSGKNFEVQLDSDVALTMQSGSKYLSLSGKARVVDDQAKINECYSSAWKVWFPEGRDDPDLTLLRVEPIEGEYWDQSGAKKLEFLWEAGKAVLQGEKLEGDELSGHAKVKL